MRSLARCDGLCTWNTSHFLYCAHSVARLAVDCHCIKHPAPSSQPTAFTSSGTNGFQSSCMLKQGAKRERQDRQKQFIKQHSKCDSNISLPPGNEPATSCYHSVHPPACLLFVGPQLSPGLPLLSHAIFWAGLEAGIHSVFAAVYIRTKGANVRVVT